MWNRPAILIHQRRQSCIPRSCFISATVQQHCASVALFSPVHSVCRQPRSQLQLSPGTDIIVLSPKQLRCTENKLLSVCMRASALQVAAPRTPLAHNLCSSLTCCAFTVKEGVTSTLACTPACVYSVRSTTANSRSATLNTRPDTKLCSWAQLQPACHFVGACTT